MSEKTQHRPRRSNCQEAENAPVIDARNLTLKTLSGPVFENVNLVAPRGCAVAIRGHHRSGKTALLLTLAGRMKQTSGTLEVAGYQLPKQRSKAMGEVGLGLFKGLNDLHKSLTVGQIISAELEYVGRKANRDSVRRYLDAWKLGDIVHKRVQELDEMRLVQLCTALAFCNDPSLVVVDDIESQLTLDESKEVMSKLIAKAHERNTCIAVGVTESSLAEMADMRLDLPVKGE